MSYLQDRKKRNSKLYLIITVVGLVVLFFLIRLGIFNFLGSLLQGVGRVFWGTKSEVTATLDRNLMTKAELFSDNERLSAKNNELEAQMQNYNTVLDENTKLKEAYGRKVGGEQLLAAILVKPGQTLYDTLIVDAGSDLNVIVGQKVFANGNILIGEVVEVYTKTAKIKLYSSSGEKLTVIISPLDITTEATGRGGGNFEMTFPRDTDIPKGTEIVVPGITPYLVGLVDEIISDPRDPLQKVILRSPVNVQQLKFVEIEK